MTTHEKNDLDEKLSSVWGIILGIILFVLLIGAISLPFLK